jgi:tRNA/rRNA methyltransferase
MTIALSSQAMAAVFQIPVIIASSPISPLSLRAFPHLMDTSVLSQLAIVLMKPKFPENIGATARIAWNMGLSRLIVVRDEEPDYESMAKMATHKAVHLIDTMELHKTLEDALAPFSCVIGTTARRGRQRILEKGPRDVVQEIESLLPDNQIAFLFGPEDRGLTNDDLKYCQLTSAIPTADFSSLNLAQAVAVHCYEIYNELIHSKKDLTPAPKFASTFELEGMYTHVEKALLRIDFLQAKNHAFWMNNIRKFLSRIRLSSKDANIIRGICRQFLWYQGTRDMTNHQNKENTS